MPEVANAVDKYTGLAQPGAYGNALAMAPDDLRLFNACRAYHRRRSSRARAVRGMDGGGDVFLRPSGRRFFKNDRSRWT